MNITRTIVGIGILFAISGCNLCSGAIDAVDELTRAPDDVRSLNHCRERSSAWWNTFNELRQCVTRACGEKPEQCVDGIPKLTDDGLRRWLAACEAYRKVKLKCEGFGFVLPNPPNECSAVAEVTDSSGRKRAAILGTLGTDAVATPRSQTPKGDWVEK